MEAHCLHKAQFKKEQDVETEVDKDENEENDDNQDQEETEDDNQDREEPNEFITNQYYPPLKHDPNVVKNNASLDANMVITGPNASGKTTYLKTTAMNIILAQQLGVGFFDSCCFVPYVHMHSYLNIPDTSGRDSLFQAESRRCKEILDAIETHHNERHFCIFDELYSGTNPEEATKAAYAFMKFISNKPNAFLLLTTHYVSICDKWKRDENIANYQMEVLCEDEQYEYTYLIKPGVSKVHGAAHILEQMDYPQSILDEIKS
jgi:DNA mismatch repair ATPase MutS